MRKKYARQIDRNWKKPARGKAIIRIRFTSSYKHFRIFNPVMCMSVTAVQLNLFQLNSIGILANANTGLELSLYWDNEGECEESVRLNWYRIRWIREYAMAIPIRYVREPCVIAWFTYLDHKDSSVFAIKPLWVSRQSNWIVITQFRPVKWCILFSPEYFWSYFEPEFSFLLV